MLQKISYNLGIATLSRGIIGGLSLVVVGILTRFLGPEGFGQYSAIFAYLYIFTAVADLGLHTFMVREISRISEPGEERKIASKIFTLRLLTVVSIIILADLLVFAFPYPLKVKLGVLIASLFSIGSSLAQVLTGIFQKYVRIYFVSFADILARFVQLGSLAILIKFETGLLWFVAVVVFSETVHLVLIYGFSRRMVKVKPMIDFVYFRHALKTAFPIAVSLVLVLIYFKLDTVMLSVMKPAQDVGIYSAAYKVLEAVIFLPAIYIGLVMPLLSRFAVKNRPEFIKTFKSAFNVVTIFALYFSVYIFLMSDWIVRAIGGGAFLEASPVLKILSFAILLIFFGNLGGNTIIALNLQRKAMWIYFTGAVINVGLNFLLIPEYSYFAAASTTVVTEIFITLAMFWLIHRSIKITVNKTLFAKTILAMTIIAVLMYPLTDSFTKASLISLLYFPLLLALRVFTRADLREIISIKKSPELPEEIENW
ncbi:MAG: flippase [Candidatus Yanofskybacteria bacterium]|nr:flippase [Candidatus Yanofskybacteria bacterium]